MNVDKFGHYIHKRMRLSELFEFNDNALLKSETGDYNLKTSRLRGIRAPIEQDDAVNKDYVDRLKTDLKQELNQLIGSLRYQILIDVQNTLKISLKAKMSEISVQLEDKYYTKAHIDKLLKQTL